MTIRETERRQPRRGVPRPRVIDLRDDGDQMPDDVVGTTRQEDPPMSLPMIFSRATQEYRCAECHMTVVPTDDEMPSLPDGHVCGVAT